jgi:protocatechuate 3,4-dioxygenase beta subunit
MPSGLTDSAVLGPFYAKNSPEYLSGESIIGEEMEGGELTLVRGHVLDTEERPIEGALLDIWQVAPNAMYAIQDKDQKNDNLRAWIYSQADGSYSFITYKPPPYPIPRDGTVGQLLNLGKRHGMRPAHIHYIVSAKGYEQVTTQLFTHDDPYLWSDAVFGEKNSLLVKYDQINDPDSECKWLLEFDFRMLKADG